LDLSSLTRFRLRRVNPYRGLVIDETTWAEAHDYHRDHVRLHTLAFHSPGVIGGLDVRPTPSQAGSVDISTGVALDPEGNILIVSQDRRVPFDGLEPGDVYLAISYLENRVNADAAAPRGAPANRIVESYRIEATNKAPENPALELGRVHWTSAEASLKPAANADNPQPDEIDLRYRMVAHAARPRPVSIGLVTGEETESHSRGITHLLREIDGVAGYQAHFRGRIALEDGVAGSDLIYLCAPVAGEPALKSLGAHLANGGAVLADPCHSGGAQLAGAMSELAERLSLKLHPIEHGDPLLDIRYSFAEPPSGARDGNVLGNGRFVLSERDYGCAWAANGAGKAALSRETVRSALEFGVNLAIAGVLPAARSA
jgi:hypothetical protein